MCLTPAPPSVLGYPKSLIFHASDFLAATQYGSNFDNTDSYIPVPVETSSWYPDSGATHHVCQDASSLNKSTPYLVN
ncbi:hypothetical protein PVK06_025403 [Gossypium arboreum]|uniref:Uncharacterized protein n=1 Tax=Gossypium arboreum TaxID=29729 RepID=A0ABR0PGF5_GOSAR|nr:hypothetical protein PVK06_025403 [Gossypium arboreum]